MALRLFFRRQVDALHTEVDIFHVVPPCLHRGYPQAATKTDQAACCLAELALEPYILLCRCCSHRHQKVKTRSKKTFGEEGVCRAWGSRCHSLTHMTILQKSRKPQGAKERAANGGSTAEAAGRPIYGLLFEKVVVSESDSVSVSTAVHKGDV